MNAAYLSVIVAIISLYGLLSTFLQIGLAKTFAKNTDPDEVPGRLRALALVRHQRRFLRNIRYGLFIIAAFGSLLILSCPLSSGAYRDTLVFLWISLNVTCALLVINMWNTFSPGTPYWLAMSATRLLIISISSLLLILFVVTGLVMSVKIEIVYFIALLLGVSCAYWFLYSLHERLHKRDGFLSQKFAGKRTKSRSQQRVADSAHTNITPNSRKAHFWYVCLVVLLSLLLMLNGAVSYWQRLEVPGTLVNVVLVSCSCCVVLSFLPKILIRPKADYARAKMVADQKFGHLLKVQWAAAVVTVLTAATSLLTFGAPGLRVRDDALPLTIAFGGLLVFSGAVAVSKYLVFFVQSKAGRWWIAGSGVLSVASLFGLSLAGMGYLSKTSSWILSGFLAVGVCLLISVTFPTLLRSKVKATVPKDPLIVMFVEVCPYVFAVDDFETYVVRAQRKLTHITGGRVEFAKELLRRSLLEGGYLTELVIGDRQYYQVTLRGLGLTVLTEG